MEKRAGSLLVPWDRLGVEHIQSDFLEASRRINVILQEGEPFRRMHRSVHCSTPRFPEGHFYAPGAFLFPLSYRDFLEEGGVFFEEVSLPSEEKSSGVSRDLVLYVGRGAADFCVDPLKEVLDWSGFPYREMDHEDLRRGLLPEDAVLLVPGGPDAGESYYAGLGDKGYAILRNHMLGKGSYFGVCAGAYLPLTSFDQRNSFWLNLVDVTDAQALDYWRTGTGFVRVSLREKHPCFYGLQAGPRNTLDLIYWEGPGMEVFGKNARSLGEYESFVASGHPEHVPSWEMGDNYPAKEALGGWYNLLSPERFEKHLRGRSAFVECRTGEGKTLLFSPHGEFGNIGMGERRKSPSFLLILDALFYLLHS